MVQVLFGTALGLRLSGDSQRDQASERHGAESLGAVACSARGLSGSSQHDQASERHGAGLLGAPMDRGKRLRNYTCLECFFQLPAI